MLEVLNGALKGFVGMDNNRQYRGFCMCVCVCVCVYVCMYVYMCACVC